MEKPFQHIHLFDTAAATDNVGDEIIVDACRRELAPLLDKAYVTTSSSHDGLGPMGRQLAAAADVVLMLGSNALSQKRARVFRPYKWHVSRADLAAVAGKVVLVGVGAAKRFERVEPAQQRFLRRLLSAGHSHSVRDGSALKIIEACGLRGINTSCPTLWRWRTDRPAVSSKPDSVCFTLTQHKSDIERDRKMIEVLAGSYETMWFWPQQPRDLGYLSELGGTGIRIVPPNLKAYDALLATGVDVVGTRLHGTIRGLQHGCHAVVIGIDNRAAEISADVGLQMVARRDVPDQLLSVLSERRTPRLRIDGAAITDFLGQFNASLHQTSDIT